jgi:hypothetical protein
VSYCHLPEPFFTQHDTGHITAHWPDPTQDSYEVAHEIVQQFVNTHNAMVDLKRWKGEALHLLAALDRCNDLLPEGAQAPLGGSKAAAVEQYLKRSANPQVPTVTEVDQ